MSGVFVVGRPTAKTPPGPPCAALWLGGAAAETLHPSQILDVAADELDWIFEHTDDETDPAVVHARAAIESWLSELADTHWAVITAQHSPVAWPEELPGHEDDSFSLVLCILCPKGPRDRRFYTAAQLSSSAHAARSRSSRGGGTRRRPPAHSPRALALRGGRPRVRRGSRPRSHGDSSRLHGLRVLLRRRRLMSSLGPQHSHPQHRTEAVMHIQNENTHSPRAALMATLPQVLVALFEVWLVLALLRDANRAFERAPELPVLAIATKAAKLRPSSRGGPPPPIPPMAWVGEEVTCL